MGYSKEDLKKGATFQNQETGGLLSIIDINDSIVKFQLKGEFICHTTSISVFIDDIIRFNWHLISAIYSKQETELELNFEIF